MSPRDLSVDVIDEEGLPRIMPASYYESTTAEERALLGHYHGLYVLPTEELVTWLADYIGERSAIEIGCGNGRMAERLDIPATDLKLQDDQAWYYEALGQPRSTYGPNVIKLEAQQAVRKFWPDVVIGCWVTHRHNKRRPSREGNMYGPNFDWILDRISEYIFIGNEGTHAKHSLWDRDPLAVHYLPFVYSRATNGGREFVGVWKGSKK